MEWGIILSVLFGGDNTYNDYNGASWIYRSNQHCMWLTAQVEHKSYLKNIVPG